MDTVASTQLQRAYALHSVDAEKKVLLDTLNLIAEYTCAATPDSANQAMAVIRTVAHHLSQPELDSIVDSLQHQDYRRAAVILGLIRERIICY